MVPDLGSERPISAGRPLWTTIAAWALAGWLTACGGGGGSTTAPVVPPPPLPVPDVSAVAAADPGSALAANWQHAAFMEIFVRSYKDSNGDGIGDLRGLITELDYLQSLGIRGLWLMPVAASADHDHGYAVADYRAIESAYGSLADLDELVTQAHLRHIGIVLDYVMNHSAATNPVFLNSRSSATNAYRKWYVWQPTAPPGWSIYGADPWHLVDTGAYFGVFSAGMPDWNLNDVDVAAYHQSNLRFWLNRGVDGFRFDAVGNLYENGPQAWQDQPQDYTLMLQTRTLLDTYARRYMVCEAPADPQGFAATAACGSAFAFDLQGSLLGAARDDAASIQALAAYFVTAPAGMATFLSNHDSFAGQRVWDQLGGDVAKYRLAAASYLLAPGTPFIYYGEEIGMAGAATLSGDAKLRTPMSWTSDAATAGFTSGAPYRALSANVASNNVAAEDTDPGSLLNFYRTLLSLRNGRASLRDGRYAAPLVTESVFAFQRRVAGETTLVVINYGTTRVTTAVVGVGPGAVLAPLYPIGTTIVAADTSGKATVSVDAQSLTVFAVEPPL